MVLVRLLLLALGVEEQLADALDLHVRAGGFQILGDPKDRAVIGSADPLLVGFHADLDR